jgi:predicted polyphosphate/ATP-dependent NAD kinase
MRAVGIIANPQSAKDARRLVADATMVGNHDKVGVVRRILRVLGHFGVQRVLMMPDEFGIGPRALDRVDAPLDLLDMPIRGTEHDSTVAARMMAPEIACLITIGGTGSTGRSRWAPRISR